jgi:hypothetical protein
MTFGEHVCGECGHQFCPECVVHPFGPSKPPLCISCALEIGGVRRQKVARPKLTRKSIKERLAMTRQARPPAPAEPEPSAPVVDEDQRWLEGGVDADDVPGGWRTSYP